MACARHLGLSAGETGSAEERLLNVDERLKVDYRTLSTKPLKGALGRRE